MDRDFTWYLSVRFKISILEDILKVRKLHPGAARRELEKPAQQHLSTLSAWLPEEAIGIKTPNRAHRNLTRLPAWLKMPGTAVLSSVKTGWRHQKYPSALKKVSSECLKTITKSLSFQWLFRFLEHYFKFSQRQSKWKRKEKNLSKIKMAYIICACTSRHQTENPWA